MLQKLNNTVPSTLLQVTKGLHPFNLLYKFVGNNTFFIETMFTRLVGNLAGHWVTETAQTPDSIHPRIYLTRIHPLHKTGPFWKGMF